ncbi:Outer membrane receptor proteins, mostly Fe transport [Zhouia amylolytica]|uniref:Outer membrane receptor proteins, mostly Fe transport n=1 Tax=Zhouia amylolytica TaxID=376730 RepID=A0A1I6UND7_9FLAO|nr:TonB-dependent receptor [Zhouia amylolytica]SFT02787.1 Outer membrane receptor proteins, mostly Fe transport [Zhouia amylolytica]
MKYFKLFSLLFLFLFCGINLYGQVRGKIIDDANTPLEYATATIYQEKDSTLVTGVVTDIDGNFEIPDLKKGTFFIKASFIGFEPRYINNIIINKQHKTQNLGTIQLRLGNELSEVVVAANKKKVISKIDRQVFEADQFNTAQGGSGADVIRNLPSVNIDGQGEINVRGSSGFVVLLNGKPLQSNPASFISQLPANAIEKVEVITAPSAKYDPEGKAGMLNIITKKGALNGAFAQVNIKGGLPSIETYGNEEIHRRYGGDFTYNIRNDRWNVSFGASYQRNDLGGRREGDVFTIINDTLTRFPSTGERSFDEINYNGRLTVDYKLNDQNDFSFGFYAGKRTKDRLADIVYYDNHAITPADGGDRIYTFQYFNHNLRTRKGDFILGSFDYAHTFQNEAELTASFLYEYTLLGGPTVNQNLGYPDTSVVYQDEYNTNDNPLFGSRFQVDYVSKPLSFGTFSLGYQFRGLSHIGDFVYERLNNDTGTFELVPEFSSDADLKRNIHSGYLQLDGTKNKWEYSAGIRLESMDRSYDLKDKIGIVDTTYHYDFIKLFPSASVQYALNETTDLKAAYSKRIERTTTFKMNPFPEREHSETLEQGDPTLKPEFIDLFEIGVNKDLKNGNTLFATAYYRNVKNVVNRVNTVYNDTILNRIYSNVGNAKTIGLELGSQFNVTEKWSNYIGGNLNHYNLKGSFNNAPVNTNNTVYSININSTYEFWKTASVQFNFNYLSERVTAQGEDSRFYSPNLTFQKSFLNNRLTATLQWLNMDMGLLNTNEQRITTYSPNQFYTTTNYIYEVDMVLLNLSYTLKSGKNKSKFIDSEFGKQEF